MNAEAMKCHSQVQSELVRMMDMHTVDGYTSWPEVAKTFAAAYGQAAHKVIDLTGAAVKLPGFVVKRMELAKGFDAPVAFMLDEGHWYVANVYVNGAWLKCPLEDVFASDVLDRLEHDFEALQKQRAEDDFAAPQLEAA